MKKKILNGLKAVGKALTTENDIADGGYSAYLIKRKLNAGGVAVASIGAMAFGMGNEGIKHRNASRLGTISYEDGLARMTKSYTTGIRDAMMEQSGGNYEIFSDMAEEVVESRFNPLDDYGANGKMISALYNMKGR